MRPPDLIIGTPDRHYLYRWHLIRTRWFNVFLHKIMLSDDDRALHDHPWDNISIILKGGYLEVTQRGAKYRGSGDIISRRAEDAHRLVLPEGYPPCWSLFITGRSRRSWGFLCPKGWQDHTTMAKEANGYSSPIGGCA